MILEPSLSRQTAIALVTAFGLLIGIVELVRRRMLKEEYSWLWLLTGAAVLGLALWPGLLAFVTKLIGAGNPPSTIFFFGVMFLVLIGLHFSVKISALTTQNKNLAQQVALLGAELRRLSGKLGSADAVEEDRSSRQLADLGSETPDHPSAAELDPAPRS